MSKATMSIFVLIVGLGLQGCESSGGSAVLGGVGGAAAGAGGYEIHLNRQKNRVEEARKKGEISQSEYEIRMDQIRRDSLIQ
jgi:hypothetical protein